jgi:hypothetical protein
MRDMELNVQQFNDYVLSLVAQLHLRGEQTQDLLVNLFKGYKACQDAEFVEHIKKKEDIYEEGGEVEYNQLMDWAVNKFKAQKEAGSWCQCTNEEETIIALQAQVLDLIKNSKADGKKSKGATKGKSEKTGKKSKNKWNAKKPAWMSTPPKDGDPQSTTVDGKEHHWCPTHKAWTRHKPSECKGIEVKNQQQESKDSKERSKSNLKTKLSKALAAIADSDDDE